VLVLTFRTLIPEFFGSQGLLSLGLRFGVFLIAASGLTFPILAGSFDFSVISMLRFSAVLCATLLPTLGFLAIIPALVACVVTGLFNGMIFVKGRIPSFMTTLGSATVLEGGTLMITRGTVIPVEDPSFRLIAIANLGLPSVAVCAIAFWGIAVFVSSYTKFGRFNTAVGQNYYAAIHSAINVDRVRIQSFMSSALYAGIAGILAAAQVGAVSQMTGLEYMLPIFAAIALGGTSLSGGVGGVHRTLVGTLIVGWSLAGLSTLGLRPEIINMTMGIVLIVALIITIERKKLGVIK
jgi:ribose transport system permease protein